jgi:hypothetical protein
MTLCATAFFASAAVAETINFKAELSGGAEVPPNASAAKGEVAAIYDTGSKVLHWKGSYSGLSGPATAGHFHGPAGPGKNAGVAVPIFSGPAKSPFEGFATLTDDQAQQLMYEQWYVNVHTSANKAGEIRGEFVKAAR